MLPARKPTSSRCLCNKRLAQTRALQPAEQVSLPLLLKAKLCGTSCLRRCRQVYR